MTKIDRLCNELSRVFCRHVNKMPIHEIIQDFMTATVYFAYQFSGKDKAEVIEYLKEVLEVCKNNIEGNE